MPYFASLIFLSQPPANFSKDSISVAYCASITAAITELKKLSVATKLLVAIDWPVLHGQLQTPRARFYDEAQRLLSRFYSLIYFICIETGVNVDVCLPGSIDANIVLLDSTPSDRLIKLDSEPKCCFAGPIVKLQHLAQRHWDLILSGEDKEAQELLRYFRRLMQQLNPLADHVNKLKHSNAITQKYQRKVPSTPMIPGSSHITVAVGGTFDHLHVGHKLLLTATAFLLQPPINSQTIRKLIVGITGDELLKNKKYPEFVRSWRQRQEDVVDFLLSILLFTRTARQDAVRTITLNKPGSDVNMVQTILDPCSLVVECVEIQDPYGPTISDESITALVVSSETRSGGQAVNQKRAEKGFSALEIFEVEVLDMRETDENTMDSDNLASKISSTEIRKQKAKIAQLSLSDIGSSF